jgi:uncharacterized protein
MDAILQSSEPGQFILTGSAVPADDITRHTGAGRIARLRLRPMTLLETGASNGNISLTQLLAGEPARSADPGLAVADLAEAIAIGGWPGLRTLAFGPALRAVRDYESSISAA